MTRRFHVVPRFISMAVHDSFFILCIFLSLQTSPLFAQEQTQSVRDRPNILFVMGDQHRWDCLGVAGNPDVQTPHLDSIAADGIHYPNTFSSYPACTPARYSLLSGLPIHKHSGWTNHSTPLPGTVTYPMLLREAGYRTKAVGKMHFTPTYHDLGFQEMLLAEQNGPGRWDDDYHRYLKSQGLVDYNDLEDQERPYRDEAREIYWETFGAMASNLPEEHHSTTWIGDRAVEEIEEWENGGNLLMVSFIKPHHPFDPPKPWDEMYEPEKMTLLPGWTDLCLDRDRAFNPGYFKNDTLTQQALKKVMGHYYATISQIDHHIGRMIDLLKEKGLYENTLIVYTSDHGEYLGFHRLLLKANYMYDPTIRIPLILKLPHSDRRGETCNQLVSNIDLAPTLLRSCGLEPLKAMEGVDLAENRNGHRKIFAEQTANDVMVRDHQYKYLQSFRKDRTELFFDLEKDPLEMENLIDDPSYQDKIGEFKTALAEWRGAIPYLVNHIDEDAPIIDRPNVPDRNDDHREEMQAYFSEAMKTPPED